MNTTTKLNAKTLIQLFAIVMITLTLFSCGGGGDTSPTTSSTTATTVSTLGALATGESNEVNIYWSEVAGATSYKLYKSTTTLSGYQNANPTNLSMLSSTVTITTLATNTTNIDLSGTQTFYFLVTVIKGEGDNEVESLTNATQTAATAFTMPFLTVVSTSTNAASATNRVWMDRNLGAAQAAISSTDTLAYGDLYQWGRLADGHQKRDSASTTIVGSITPTHGEFITNIGDWTTADSSGTLRSVNWTKIDGSSICPTGFRVPTHSELIAELSSWSAATRAGAYASNLKWPAAGIRYYNNLNIRSIGTSNYIWSSTAVADNLASNIRLADFNADTYRAYGFSVRCIKD